VRELSLHLLDIAENSIAAEAKNITIEIEEDSNADLLKLKVEDDGRGMSEEMARQVVDPFVTTRTTRKVGLGIPLLKEAAEACNGSLTLSSEIGKGTSILVTFQRSHIDRMPLGDISTTFLNLLVSNPEIHWSFTYQSNNNIYRFDDVEIKETIGDVPLTEPEILSVLRQMIDTGIEEVQTTK
jgi:hypothetical protein